MANRTFRRNAENLLNIMHIPENIPGRLRSFFTSPRGWLTMLLCLHLCANIWWLWADNHAVVTDEETHMIMARDYYNALFPTVGERGLGARLAALGRIKADVGNPVHPPLLHIAGAVLARVLGYSMDHMAFANTLAFLIAIIGVYVFARLFLDGRESFFAALVFSLTPMIYTSSRYFMTDFMSMAVVVWVMYALMRSERFTCLKWSALFGLLNGLALMTRTTVVLYYFVPSLVVFGVAVYDLFERGADGKRTFNQMGLARLALNAFLIVMITFAVASPWYIAHGAQFYKHWMKPQKGGAGSPIALLQYSDRERPELPAPAPAAQAQGSPGEDNVTDTAAREESDEEAAPARADKTAAPAPAEPAVEDGAWRFLPKRRIGWVRYPVFVINNAVFLPMFIMSLIGMVVALSVARFRKGMVSWLLLLWLLSSYVLLTTVLSFGTPRYAMQALPALTLLSVLPVFALPRGAGRTVAQVLYAGVLVFQYGNLTVHAYGALAEAKIPVIIDKQFQPIYDDLGLYFFKSVLHGSNAYGRMQAPTGNNFKDRLFFSMLKAEQERSFSGIEGNYARLNIRGMILDEEHFWLDGNGGNPFRRKDIPPELTPYRNLRHYGWGRDLDSILPVIDLVDYVAYTTEDITPEKEQEWLKTIEGRGFELIERFLEPRYGMVQAKYFGLLARKPGSPLPQPQSQDDIWKLRPELLYKIRYSAVFPRMAPDLRETLISRMNGLFQKMGKSMRLNDSVDFRGAAVTRDREGQFSVHFILYVREPVAINYRMMFRGIVEPQFMASHFGSAQGKAGVFRWNFDPTPSPKSWPKDNFVMLRFPMTVPAIPYQMSFAFYTASEGVWGDAIDLGKIDFSKVPQAQN